MIATMAVMDSLLGHAAGVESLAVLPRFRLDFHGVLTARSDELNWPMRCCAEAVRTPAGRT